MSRGAHRVSLLAMALLTAVAVNAAADRPMRFLEEPVEGEYNVLCPIIIEGAGELRVGFDAYASARPDEGGLSWLSVTGRQAGFYRLQDGEPVRVGNTAPVDATGPTQLTIQRRAGRVCAIIGDQIALDMPWDAPAGGKVGVSSDGRYVAGKPSIQPVDPPFVTDDFTRDADALGLWETSRGSFENTMIAAPGAQANMSANPFSLHVRAEDGAVATTGYWFWDSYRVGLSVRPVSAPAVELRAWVQDDENYLALRWHKGDDDLPAARQLVLIRGGVECVLDQAGGGFEPDEWYRLEMQVTPGRVVGLIDREQVLVAKTVSYTHLTLPTN